MNWRASSASVSSSWRALCMVWLTSRAELAPVESVALSQASAPATRNNSKIVSRQGRCITTPLVVGHIRGLRPHGHCFPSERLLGKESAAESCPRGATPPSLSLRHPCQQRFHLFDDFGMRRVVRQVVQMSLNVVVTIDNASGIVRQVSDRL